MQLVRRQGQRIQREPGLPQAQRRQRGRRQPDPELVQLARAMPQHGVGRSVGDEAAVVVEHDDPVDEAHGGVEVVLDEHDRTVAGRHEICEGRVHLVDSLGIEVRGGFVEDEQGRPHRQRARDRESLAAAARQAIGVLATTVPEPDAAQRDLGALEDFGHRHPQILGSERDLVENRAGHELGVGVLEDHADAGAERGDGRRGRIDAVDQDPSSDHGGHGVGDEAVQREGQRRLARAARAEDQHDLARADVERHSGGGRGIRPLMRDRKTLDREEGVRSGRRLRGGGLASRCAHGSSRGGRGWTRLA